MNFVDWWWVFEGWRTCRCILKNCWLLIFSLIQFHLVVTIYTVFLFFDHLITFNIFIFGFNLFFNLFRIYLLGLIFMALDGLSIFWLEWLVLFQLHFSLFEANRLFVWIFRGTELTWFWWGNQVYSILFWVCILLSIGTFIKLKIETASSRRNKVSGRLINQGSQQTIAISQSFNGFPSWFVSLPKYLKFNSVV